MARNDRVDRETLDTSDKDDDAGTPPSRTATRTFASGAELFSVARAATANVRLPRRLLNHLYEHSRCKGMPREAWEREIQFAVALQQTLKPFLDGPWKIVEEVIDQDAVAAVQQSMATSPATLAIGFHGGFPRLRRKLFEKLFRDSVVIGRVGPHGATDGAHALFAAREAILASKPVLMAPDGLYGKESGTITVLGARRAVTDGAPFLAHSTNGRVAWFAVACTGERFAPTLVEGPRAEPGESFKAYRERFFRFFADQIEAVFTGDPRNIDVQRFWQATFEAMFTGRPDRKRRSSSPAQASLAPEPSE